MKALWFFPLTFLAGADGFAMFAPYVALVMAAFMVTHRKQRPALVSVKSLIAPPPPGV